MSLEKIGSPELASRDKWSLVDALLQELLGGGVELLGGHRIEYQEKLGWHDSSLPMLELRQKDGRWKPFITANMLFFFADQSCDRGDKLACTQQELYHCFRGWWKRHNGMRAPEFEIFLDSVQYRQIRLIGEPWFVGIAPKENTQLRLAEEV